MAVGSRWVGIAFLAAPGLALGCGGERTTEAVGSISASVVGNQTQTWSSTATPWGGVGKVVTEYNDCADVCADGLRPNKGSPCQTHRVCSQEVRNCSGALIARDVVLTAAHCYCKQKTASAFEITRITFQPIGADPVEVVDEAFLAPV